MSGCGWCVLHVDSESVWEETWQTPTGNANAPGVCCGGEGANCEAVTLIFLDRLQPPSSLRSRRTETVWPLTGFRLLNNIYSASVSKIEVASLFFQSNQGFLASQELYCVATSTLAIFTCFSLPSLPPKVCVLERAVVRVSLRFSHNFCCCMFLCLLLNMWKVEHSSSFSWKAKSCFFFFFF